MGEIKTLDENDIARIVIDCMDSYRSKKMLGEKPIINEVVNYQLFKRGLINEMAFKKKDFIRHLNCAALEIIEYWCLCMYCHLYEPQNEKFYHWMDKLNAQVKIIKNATLKHGANKLKAIKYFYIEGWEYNIASTVESYIKDIFEGQEINIEYIKPVAEICATSMNDFVDFLANDNYSISQYNAKVFGVEY